MFFLRRIYIVFLAFFPSYQYAMQENNNIVNKNNNKTIKKLTKKNNTKKPNIAKQVSFFGKVNRYMNKNKLSYLWMFLDNVPFQYGGSKILKHGEAYYGLSNGIGFFPSFLNFGWLKIGIGDTHINVINTIIKFMKTYTAIAYNYYYKLRDKNNNNHHKNPLWLNILKWWLFYTVVTDIHLFSLKFFNCVKIKIISIGAFVTNYINDSLLYPGEDHWYFSFFFNSLDEQLKVPEKFFILSPRIEINIPRIIDLF